ncbi:hypothetical protein FRC08_016788 [Ceratobasidium sp. 394]|nr:hypothetical protein FRC08_016788 [Ceratobasidium sp. 394]
MSLPGARVDGPNAEAWTRRLVKGIRLFRARNASKSEVFARVEDKARGTEGCCLYFQGHGIFIPGRVNRYLTAQNSVNEGENWNGLDPKDMRKLLSLTNHLAWRIIATDFCHSGNCFALRYVLCIEGDIAEWKEVAGWSGSEPCAPTIHIAGSKENELVYEGSQTGGFFTEALTESRAKMLTLPDLLRAVRSKVNRSLDAAKLKGAIERDKTQTPQIFSSVKLSLEDTHALIKFQQGQSA